MSNVIERILENIEYLKYFLTFVDFNLIYIKL